MSTDITLSFDSAIEAQTFMDWLEDTMEFAQNLNRYADVIAQHSKQVDRSVKGYKLTVRVK